MWLAIRLEYSDVLGAVQDLPDSLGLVSGWVPEMHREDQRIPPRMAVEDALRRGVGD